MIYQLTQCGRHGQWLAAASRADDYTLKLAVFHTLFNLLGIVLMLPFIKVMVGFLQRVIKPRESSAAQPRYLNMRQHRTARHRDRGGRQETLHLYDNASAIIARGLSLDLDEILSERAHRGSRRAGQKPAAPSTSTRATTRASRACMPRSWNSSAARSRPCRRRSRDELFALRAAGRDIVEAIKDTKHLQKNLSTYMVSDNEPIRREYDRIRVHLAVVLRELDQVRQMQ